MLNNVSEKTMHRVRWLLAIGWLILIVSMFYDPITPRFTAPGSGTPFSLNPNIYLDPTRCVRIREMCVQEQPFSMTVLIWWAMIVPAGIFVLLVLGHEFWRRICPLSFFSQIPRALGIQRRRKVVDSITQEVRYEVVTIGEHSWLGRNHLYVQYFLFVVGLGLRILFVNGHRASLGYFLIFTILSAMLVGWLYAGKSWCNYFCPMAPVQMVYTGPRSLLGSQAHTTPGAITQSMCRSIDPTTRQEQSACVSCKSPCIDIDAEKAYWEELKKPGRRLVQYGYIGMVIAFYFYYFLYSGNWDYYFTGAWTHEEDLLTKLFDPGFYINGQIIYIPKVAAVYITYIVFTTATFIIGLILEKLYRRFTIWRGRPASAEQAQHVMFTLFTAASFWTFFSYGARPTLNRMPTYPLLAFNALIVLVGAIWLYRTLGRTRPQYERERMATSLRKQLARLNIDPSLLEGRSIDDLSPDEAYTLVKVLPRFSQQQQLEMYKGMVQDALEQQVISVPNSFDFFKKLRQEFQLQDADHFAILEAIATTNPNILISPDLQRSVPIHDIETAAKTIGKHLKRKRS